MTFRNDETIQCIRCGRPFTWSYGEQRFYRERNLHQPKRCPQCREIVRGEQRSSQIDHPLSERPHPPMPEPTKTPLLEKRPFQWQNPIHKMTIILWLLSFIFLILILLIIATLL